MGRLAVLGVQARRVAAKRHAVGTSRLPTPRVDGVEPEVDGVEPDIDRRSDFVRPPE